MWEDGLIAVTLLHIYSHSSAASNLADIGKSAGTNNHVNVGVNIAIDTLSGNIGNEDVSDPACEGKERVCGDVGPPTQKILGGCQVKRSTFPWQVSMARGRRPGYHSCGGVIVSPDYVLSAAHCFVKCYSKSDCNCKDMGPVSAYLFVVGKHWQDDRKDEMSPDYYKSDKVVPHPKYYKRGKDCSKMSYSSYYAYDYAIIKLSKSIPLGINAKAPAMALHLPDYERDDELPVDSPLALSGWGRLWAYDKDPEGNFKSCPPEKLNALQLYATSDKQCEETSEWGDLDESEVCARATGADACKGDSGGPLAYLDPNSEEVKLIGLVSFGELCYKYLRPPGVYAKITTVLRENAMGSDNGEWREHMKEVIKGNEKTKKEGKCMTGPELDPYIKQIFFD